MITSSRFRPIAGVSGSAGAAGSAWAVVTAFTSVVSRDTVFRHSDLPPPAVNSRAPDGQTGLMSVREPIRMQAKAWSRSRRAASGAPYRRAASGAPYRRAASGAPPLLTTPAIAGCCGGFVVLGTLQALYGPAIPAFRARFGVTPAAAGLGLSADFAGAIAGVVLYHLLLARAGDRRLLGGSYVLMAAGMMLFALAPSWPLALGAALVTGFGSGGIDYGLNHLFATGFGHRSTAMLNLLNAFFGVGAVIGQALIGAVGAARYPWLFGAAAVVSLLLIPTLRGVRAQAAGARAGEATVGEQRRGRASPETARLERPAPETSPPRSLRPRGPPRGSPGREPGPGRSSRRSSPSTSCTWRSSPAWAAGSPPSWRRSATARPWPPPRPRVSGSR